MKKSVIIGLTVFVSIVGVFLLTTQSAKSPEPTLKTEASAENTITYTDNGFEPDSLTVAAGDAVGIKNESSKSLQFSSDDHPTHTKNSELNRGVLTPGKKLTFEVIIIGTYGFHDHLNDENTGTLIVE